MGAFSRIVRINAERAAMGNAVRSSKHKPTKQIVYRITIICVYMIQFEVFDVNWVQTPFIPTFYLII